jgi:hypothetical protein
MASGGGMNETARFQESLRRLVGTRGLGEDA